MTTNTFQTSDEHDISIDDEHVCDKTAATLIIESDEEDIFFHDYDTSVGNNEYLHELILTQKSVICALNLRVLKLEQIVYTFINNNKNNKKR